MYCRSDVRIQTAMSPLVSIIMGFKIDVHSSYNSIILKSIYKASESDIFRKIEIYISNQNNNLKISEKWKVLHKSVKSFCWGINQ